MNGKKKPICIYQAQCAFFNKADKTSAEKTLNELYCFTSPKHCEILKRFRGGKPVPDSMLPNGTSQTYEDSPQKIGITATEIAGFATDQLKKRIAVVNELSISKQDEIRDIIRNAALRVLKQNKGDNKSAK